MRDPQYLEFYRTGRYRKRKHYPQVYNAATDKFTQPVDFANYDIVGNDAQSKLLLEGIRTGIQRFLHNAHRVTGTVFEKYLLEIIQFEGDIETCPRMSSLVPAVFSMLIAINRDTMTEANKLPILPRLEYHINELCFNWFCNFWVEDPERLSVGNKESYDDYRTRGLGIGQQYGKLKFRLNAGYALDDFSYNAAELKTNAKNHALSKSKAISLDDFAAMDKTIPVPKDDPMELPSGNIEPTVLKTINASFDNENKILEQQALAKKTQKELVASMGFDPVTTQQPIHPVNQENNPMINMNTQQNFMQPMANTVMPLQDRNQRPILMSSGQQINFDYSLLGGQQGFIEQAIDNHGQPLFDNTNHPIVFFIANQAKMLIDLTGSQETWYNAYNIINGQSNQNPPAPVAGYTETGNSQVDADLSFMKALQQTAAAETPAPATQPGQALTVDQLHQMMHGETPTVAKEAEMEPVKETPTEDSIFFQVTLEDGMELKAALVKDLEYFRKDTVEIPLIFSEEFLVGIAYEDDRDVEFIVCKDRFMDREVFKPYVLSPGSGEVSYKSARKAAVVGAKTAVEMYAAPPKEAFTLFEDDLTVTSLVKLSNAMLDNNSETSIAIGKFSAEHQINMVSFEDEPEPVAEDVTGGLRYLSMLQELYGLAVKESNEGLLNHMTGKFTDYIFDMLVYRLPLGLGRDTKIGNAFTEFESIVAFLNDKGMMTDFMEMFEKDAPKLFNLQVVGDEPDRFVVDNHSGYAVHLGSMKLDQEFGYVSPKHNEALWDTLYTIFKLTGTKDRLYAFNFSGEVYEFICESIEFGVIRLVSVHNV